MRSGKCPNSGHPRCDGLVGSGPKASPRGFDLIQINEGLSDRYVKWVWSSILQRSRQVVAHPPITEDTLTGTTGACDRRNNAGRSLYERHVKQTPRYAAGT